MSLTMQMGARLRAARMAAGFNSLRRFAAKINVPFSTYAQHETGSRSMDDEAVTHYCKTLNINPEWLKTGTGIIFRGKHSPNLKPTEKEIAYIKEMNKITGCATDSSSTINQPLLAEILEQVLHFHQSQKSNASLKNIVNDVAALYADISANGENTDMQKKLLKSALNAYKRFQ